VLEQSASQSTGDAADGRTNDPRFYVTTLSSGKPQVFELKLARKVQTPPEGRFWSEKI
jgi:hypothetical protein